MLPPPPDPYSGHTERPSILRLHLHRRSTAADNRTGPTLPLSVRRRTLPCSPKAVGACSRSTSRFRCRLGCRCGRRWRCRRGSSSFSVGARKRGGGGGGGRCPALGGGGGGGRGEGGGAGDGRVSAPVKSVRGSASSPPAARRSPCSVSLRKAGSQADDVRVSKGNAAGKRFGAWSSGYGQG